MPGGWWSALTPKALRAPVAVSAAQVAVNLSDMRVAPGHCLFAQGQWPHRIATEWAERIGVFAVDGNRVRLVLDCWMTRAAIEELRSRVPEAASGRWDVMFAGRWRYAWGGTPFQLWNRRGIIAQVEGPRRVAIGLGGAAGPSRDLAEVRAEISRDWVTHELSVMWADGATTTLARHREWAARLDPLYDGLNLLADAGWLAALGSDLAAAAGAPLHANDPALRRTGRDAS